MLTDVVLPNMGRPAMATQQLQRYPESRVLHMSRNTDDAIVHHAVLEPGMWFRQKPFNAEGLVTRVRDVLDAHLAPASSLGV